MFDDDHLEDAAVVDEADLDGRVTRFEGLLGLVQIPVAGKADEIRGFDSLGRLVEAFQLKGVALALEGLCDVRQAEAVRILRADGEEEVAYLLCLCAPVPEPDSRTH